ncbi:substrate-binding and VWA domain-containing protein [Nocardiopsis coralliicola]
MGRHRGNHEDDSASAPDAAGAASSGASGGGGAGRSRRAAGAGGGRPEGRTRRRRRGGAIAAIAAACAIVLAVGLTGTYIFISESGCSGTDITLDVAVSPEMAAPAQAVAQSFNEADHAVDGQCVRAEVSGAEPADVAYGITGGGPTMGDTDSQVWIPDSSLWVSFVQEQAGKGGVTDTGTSIASSPLVLAQPADSEGGGEDKDKASWSTLVPTSAPSGGSGGTDVRLVDPVRSSSGLATLALISAAIDDGDQEGRPQLVAALQSLQKGATPNEEAAFEAFAKQSAKGGDDPVLVLSEQAALRYNAAHTDAPAEVGYPESGSYNLDYPYVTRTDDPLTTRAAEVFRAALTDASAQDRFLEEGFRTADGSADPEVLTEDMGFSEKAPESLPTPSSGTIQSLTQAWNQFKLGTRLLTIIDVSGSMLEQVPGTGATRMQVMTSAAQEGLTLFPEDTELGIWEFSVGLDGDLDHRERLPIAELGSEGSGGGTHEQDIAGDLSEIEPVSDGDTGLYDTYLAAYREMMNSYKSDRVNAILMLTDGNDDDPDGISLKQLASAIEEEGSPNHPIPVFTIAFGPNIDLEPMKKVAELTGGEAYQTEDPSKIGDIFLQAFSQRLEGAGGTAGAGGS